LLAVVHAMTTEGTAKQKRTSCAHLDIMPLNYVA
jgi:hypothetical protein